MGLRDLLNVALSSIGDKTSDWWRGRGGRLSSAGSSPPPPESELGASNSSAQGLVGDTEHTGSKGREKPPS